VGILTQQRTDDGLGGHLMPPCATERLHAQFKLSNLLRLDALLCITTGRGFSSWYP